MKIAMGHCIKGDLEILRIENDHIFISLSPLGLQPVTEVEHY